MKKTVIFISILFAIFSISGCTTVKEIPENLTSAQLLQRGLAASDASDFKGAELYYKTVIERFGSDTETYISAKYELGHLYFKQKQYDKAKSAFEEILEIYDNAGFGVLPPSYKKLSQLQLAEINK